MTKRPSAAKSCVYLPFPDKPRPRNEIFRPLPIGRARLRGPSSLVPLSEISSLFCPLLSRHGRFSCLKHRPAGADLRSKIRAAGAFFSLAALTLENQTVTRRRAFQAPINTFRRPCRRPAGAAGGGLGLVGDEAIRWSEPSSRRKRRSVWRNGRPWPGQRCRPLIMSPKTSFRRRSLSRSSWRP